MHPHPIHRFGRRRVLQSAVFVFAVVSLLLAGLAGGGVGAMAETGEDRRFEIRIENGVVPAEFKTVRVRRGDRVRLRWLSDAPIALHLHGYDIETKVTADAPSETVFEARATGRFPVTVHEARAAKSGRQSHHEKVLLYLEVHPR